MWGKLSAWYRDFKLPHNTYFEFGKAVPILFAMFVWGAVESIETLEYACLGQSAPGIVTKVESHHTGRSPKAAAAAMSYVDYATVSFEFQRDGERKVEQNDYPLPATFSVGDTVEVRYLPGHDMRAARLVAAPRPPALYFFLTMMSLSGLSIVVWVLCCLREPDYVRNSRYRSWQKKQSTRNQKKSPAIGRALRT